MLRNHCESDMPLIKKRVVWNYICIPLMLRIHYYFRPWCSLHGANSDKCRTVSWTHHLRKPKYKQNLIYPSDRRQVRWSWHKRPPIPPTYFTVCLFVYMSKQLRNPWAIWLNCWLGTRENHRHVFSFVLKLKLSGSTLNGKNN